MLAGASPVSAVRYQIVIMFVIASAAALGTLAVCLAAFLALFSDRHQLRLTRLRHAQQTDFLQRIRKII